MITCIAYIKILYESYKTCIVFNVKNVVVFEKNGK